MGPLTSATASATVSVIIPTHDRLQRLPVAIDSVQAQTYPVHELIVVDDGSTDDTASWIAQHHPEITLIRQSNHGVSHARNQAIERSSGDWIALLDSDDHWYPDKLAEQVTALQQAPGLRLCHCDEHWRRNGKRVNPKHKHRKYGGDVFSHCLPLCCISPSAVLIHRTLFDELGLFDESLPACEDYDLWLRICAREPVLFIDKALLEKTGGHEDQLSQRFPAMDQFRLQALAKLLRSHSLTDAQTREATSMFQEKFTIFSNGARKRHHYDTLNGMQTRYRDLLESAIIL